MEINHKPIRGLMAVESKTVLDRLTLVQPGETVSYVELNDLTQCDVRKQRYVLTTPINKLLCEQGKVFVAERGVGIRLLHNSEIPSLGQRDISRVGNISRRCLRRLSAVSFDTLPPDRKVAHNTAMTVLALFQRGSTAKTVRRIEEAVKTTSSSIPINETLKLFGQV
jgi:hypothetical protein